MLRGNVPCRRACNAKNRFHSSRCSQQMAELALGGKDGDVIGGSAQAAAQRPCFGKVSQAGAGGVGLNGTEIARVHPRPIRMASSIARLAWVPWGSGATM